MRAVAITAGVTTIGPDEAVKHQRLLPIARTRQAQVAAEATTIAGLITTEERNFCAREVQSLA